MLDMEKLGKLAEDFGFTAWGELDMSTLEFKPEVRDMCEANTCGQWNRTWACPPACGTLEEMKQRCPGARVYQATRSQCEFEPLALAYKDSKGTAILVIQPDDAMRSHLLGAIRNKRN